MCYNPETSALFFCIGITTTLYVYIYSPSLRKTKIHFLLYETKVLFVKCLKRHFKLQHLFCGPLFNQ